LLFWKIMVLGDNIRQASLICWRHKWCRLIDRWHSGIVYQSLCPTTATKVSHPHGSKQTARVSRRVGPASSAGTPPARMPIVLYSWRPALRQRSRDRRRDDVINQGARACAVFNRPEVDVGRFVARMRCAAAAAIREPNNETFANTMRRDGRSSPQTARVICITARGPDTAPHFCSRSATPDSTGCPLADIRRYVRYLIASRAGSKVVRIDPFRFLAGCRIQGD